MQAATATTAAAWPLAGSRKMMVRTAPAAAAAGRKSAPTPTWRERGPSPLTMRRQQQQPPRMSVRARATSPSRASTHQVRAAVASPPPPTTAAAPAAAVATAPPRQEEDGGDDPSAAAAAAAADGSSDADPAAPSPSPSSLWDKVTSKVGTRRFRALAMLNGMVLLLGSNWTILKLAANAGVSGPAIDPPTFTALRFALATAAFSPWLLRGFADRAVTRVGAELGAWCAAGYVTQAVALSMTPASRASLLSTFTVLIVPIFAALRGQKIRPLVWGCAGAAVAGTLLLEAGSAEPPNVGDAWAILSAAAFAGQLFRTEVLTRDLPAGSSLPLMAVSMATIAGVTAGVAGVADWRDAASTADALGNMAGGVADVFAAGHPLGAHHAAGLLAAGELAFTAWLSTALALLLELIALKDVSSTEAALVYSMEPLVGASLSCMCLGERFGPTGMAGAAIILASSLATQMAGAASQQQDEAAGGGGGGGGAA